MNLLIKILFCTYFFYTWAAPVRKTPEKSKITDLYNDIDYKTYLEEIVNELERDKTFTERIKQATEHNRTKHIAESLQFVHHSIRNKLDEIKRREIARLNIFENELERRKLEKNGAKVPQPNSDFIKLASVDRLHLDHNNVHTFEINDLEMLIKKAEEDLMKVDKEQDEQYKEHEIKKEYLKKKKLDSIKDAEERKKLEEQFIESEKRHKNHSKIHHPGNEEQLKEVWDKKDHLDPKEFNPKTFFDLHDVNGDGHLDINEVESLMENELSKVYEGNNSDDDMQEKYHEMMRMRQELMRSMDQNKDNVISKEEFVKYTSSRDYKDDTEWKTQEEENKKPYSDKEYKEFEEEYGRNEEEEDDEFSDQDESLRHIPKVVDPVGQPDVNAKNVPPPINPEVKIDNQNNKPSHL